MEKRLRIFFAIPFDPESMSMYKDYVIPYLQEKYRNQAKLECVIGNQVIGVPEPYGSIETFKMQNTELFRHFVKGVRDADIIVADLTGNNPNVHVELGIALYLNKNILRVTRGPYADLAFDVKGYEVIQSKVKEDLFDTVNKYLNLFLQIKSLDFDNFHQEISELYYFHPERKPLVYWDNEDDKRVYLNQISRVPKAFYLQHFDSGFRMRDGKVQVTFEIKDERDKEDWFGVYLRAGKIHFQESILVYVRKRGDLEIVTYPRTEENEVDKYRKKLPDECIGPKTLTIELDGDYIKASVDAVESEREGLSIQSIGEVKFAAHLSNVDFWDVKIVRRDTIETFDSFS